MKRRRTPSYCLHRASGKAVVRLSGRDIYLGPHGSPESKRRYGEVIAAWLEGADPAPRARGLTVAELVERFVSWARENYPAGRNGGQANTYRLALRPIVEHLELEAASFGPLQLRAVRHRMIEADLCRSEINRRVGLIRTVFAWGVGRELVPSSVVEALRCVEPLRRGSRGVRESEPVRPVALEIVERTIEHTSPPVAAMIRLQLLTGARPGEVCSIRPVDLDTSGPVWWFKPRTHKNAHRGHERVIPLIEAAQDVVRPFLVRPVDAPCFSPAEAVKWHREQAHAKRVTPLSCGNRPGLNRVRRPTVEPGASYDAMAYANAIRKATRRAFPGPLHLGPGELRAWRREHPDEAKRWDAEHSWSPNQIRHLTATMVRKRYGLDAARVVLGHSSADVTARVYAEVTAEHAADLLGRYQREVLAS